MQVKKAKKQYTENRDPKGKCTPGVKDERIITIPARGRGAAE